MNSDQKAGLVLLFLVVGFIGSLFGLYFIGGPIYSVWSAEYKGKAELARAEQNRQILVTQAKAEKEAATARAEAIAIMGKAAKEFPEYRQQEFMASFGEALREGHISQVIYVPTEANLPILPGHTGPRK